MTPSKLLSLACVVLLSLAGQLPTAHAVLTYTVSGDVSPTNPSTWDSSTHSYIGYSSPGILTLTSGNLLSEYGDLGYASASATGSVTVDGSSSTWAIGNEFDVGFEGSGMLNITNGGVVTTGSSGFVAFAPGSTGTMTVDGVGSKWTNGYDSYVGFGGTGILKITNRGTVTSGSAYIGYKAFTSDAVGSVVVDGAGSTWTSNSIQIGYMGSGTLTVTSGGTVSDADGYIGSQSGALGIVTVKGAGSKWTNTDDLYIGSNGNGTLNVVGGGIVSVGTPSINGQSLLAIDVGRGSSLSVSNSGGTITNNGTVRILAGAGVPAGIPSTPISATTWSGTGLYQPVGGTWNSGSHQFTASAVQTGNSGTPVTIDLSQKQRVRISDTLSTNWSIGASFLAAPNSSSLTFTATAASDGTLTALTNSLTTGQSVLGAWNFTTAGGYTLGGPAYLLFGVGSGRSADGLEIWHYDGSAWSTFSAPDLTYDGTYASFTVTDLSGFAVTGVAVPEPTTFALLLGLVLSWTGFAAYKTHRP